MLASTSLHEHDISPISSVILLIYSRLLFKDAVFSFLQSMPPFFPLKKVNFWNTFFIFPDPKVRLTLISAFLILSCFSLLSCIDHSIDTPNRSFLDMNFRLTCFQPLRFLLYSPKTPHWNDVAWAEHYIYRIRWLPCLTNRMTYAGEDYSQLPRV